MSNAYAIALCTGTDRSYFVLVSGYGAISQWLLPHPNPPTMVKWGTAMYVLSMATNILVTAAIASRIWYGPFFFSVNDSFLA